MIGLPSNYLLLAKIGLVGALLLGVYLTGRHQGENAVQADWDRYKAQMIDAQSKLIQEHANEIERLREQQNADNVAVSKNHQGELDAIQKKLDDSIANARANGLRIPRSACGGSFSAITQAPGDGGHDADLAGTIALPDQITNDLLNLAAEADRTAAIGRACQAWVIKNGFYNAQ